MLLDRIRRGGRRGSACQWHGRHAGGTVELWVSRPCGHGDPRPVPTCDAHLALLSASGGVAERAAPCPVCGAVGRASVDLGE